MKQKRTIPKLCFPGEPLWLGHTLLNRTVSLLNYLETTGKGGKSGFLVTDHLVRLGTFWYGCWGAYGEVAGGGVSLEPRVRRFSIDVIEKTPKFTTKFYRLDTPSFRKVLYGGAAVGSGAWVVKIRVSPSGLLQGTTFPSACWWSSWDQARWPRLSSFVWCAGCPRSGNNTGWSKTIVQGKPWLATGLVLWNGEGIREGIWQ